MGAARTPQRRTSGHALSAEARSPAARPGAHRGTLTQDERPDRAGVIPSQATGAIRIDIHTAPPRDRPLLVAQPTSRRRPPKGTAQSWAIARRYTSVFVLIPGENFF
jgi:hypothetical protein